MYRWIPRAGVFMIAVLLLTAGCTAKASTRVTSASSDLTKYEACAVQIDDSGLTRNDAHGREVLLTRLRSELSAHGVCEVKPDGDLLLRLRGRLDESTAPSGGLGGKDFTASFEVVLVDAKTGRGLGTFKATGNTRSEVQTSVNGASTDIVDAGGKEDLALRNAADQIVETLQDKRGGGRVVRAPAGHDAGAQLEASRGSTSAPTGTDPGPAAPASVSTSAAAAPASVSTSAAAAPASVSTSAAAARLAPGCSLVCNVAHKGRAAPADEARLGAGLAEAVQALHQCTHGSAPAMTLRFDSTGALTSFGVDDPADEHGDRACIDSINQRRPAISHPGPATVRCAEICASAR